MTVIIIVLSLKININMKNFILKANFCVWLQSIKHILLSKNYTSSAIIVSLQAKLV